MSDEEPTVPIYCPECGTETRVPLSEVETTITQHNENQHDETNPATVDPAIKEHLADLAAEDLGLLE